MVYAATCTVGNCTSNPATFTVVVAPAVANGSFEGYLYGADCNSFRGWVWNRNKVNSAITVDILDGATTLATLVADEFRPDLLQAGKGNGKHAFHFTIPDALKDGIPHNLSARVSGNSFALKNFPKTITCKPGTSPTNQIPVGPSSITNLSAQVGVPYYSGVLSAFTDPEEEALTYALIGLPNGMDFSIPSRVISGIPTVAGNFTLIYSGMDSYGASSNVSISLTVKPASLTTLPGDFDGYLDKVECGTIRGWVWERNKPNMPISVEIFSKTQEGVETVWGSTVGNIYRDDLKNAGKGNGSHAYSFMVPNGLKDGTLRVMYGRVLGSTYILKDSGKSLICNTPVRLSAETGSELSVLILGNPVEKGVVEVEVKGAKGQPVTLLLIDIEGKIVGQSQVNMTQNIEHHRIAFGQKPAGLLLLRVSTPTNSKTLKVVNEN